MSFFMKLGTSHCTQGQGCHSEGSRQVGQQGQQELHEIQQGKKMQNSAPYMSYHCTDGVQLC